MNDNGNNSQQHGIAAGDSSGSSSSSNNAPLQYAATISGSIRRPPSPQESRVSPQENRIGMIRFPAQPPLRATEEETAAGKRKRGGRSYDPGSGSGSSRMKFDGPDMVSPCSVCGKRFRSWKAIFGHMRSHPERSWRGVHPPPTFHREGSPDDQGPRDSSKSASAAGGEGEETGAYLLRLATQVQSNMEKGQRLSSSGSAGEEEMTPEDPSSALHVAGASLPRPRRGLDLDLNQPYVRNPSTPSSEDTQGFSLDLNFPPASPQS